jgi:lipopolysaccharide export system protein LptC
VLRIAMPTLAGILVVLALFWPQLLPRDGRIGIDIATVEGEHGSNSEAVSSAIYSGVDHLGRPFLVKAQQVVSSPEEKHLMQLTKPDARIDLKDGTTVTLSAETGLYDRKEDRLALAGDVTLKRGTTLTVKTAKALIELDAGTAQGDQPVEGESTFGTIAGQGFRVADRGATIFVDGPAKMLIWPQRGATLQ